MSNKTETPYERGYYEGSRGLPITLYAMQMEQNEYERGRRDGTEARQEYYRERAVNGEER